MREIIAVLTGFCIGAVFSLYLLIGYLTNSSPYTYPLQYDPRMDEVKLMREVLRRQEFILKRMKAWDKSYWKRLGVEIQPE